MTGVDISPSTLAQARENAEIADATGIDFRRGDAAGLSLKADRFDVTLSSLGHMYADPPDDATRELVRVTRPGGTIGFTAWAPTGLFPQMAAVAIPYIPPSDRPEFTEPPFAWGDPDVVRDRLGDAVDDIAFEKGTTAYPSLSPGHFWREMATHSAAFVHTIEAVDENDRGELRRQMIETIEPFFSESENAVELTSLQTIATAATVGSR